MKTVETMMTTDELKAAWAAVQGKLDGLFRGEPERDRVLVQERLPLYAEALRRGFCASTIAYW